jgi:hypothetical protein
LLLSAGRMTHHKMDNSQREKLDNTELPEMAMNGE